MLGEDKSAELEALYEKVARFKAKQRADAFVKDRDEREARGLEELLAVNKDNKKFKPPKPKTVDPKKAAQEWQDLFTKFAAELRRPVRRVTAANGEATTDDQQFAETSLAPARRA